MPFQMMQCVCLFAPADGRLKFVVNNFACHAYPIGRGTLRVCVSIEAFVSAYINKGGGEKRYISSARMMSQTSVIYGFSHLKARASEYHAIADGKKREYTNKDAIKAYGGNGIVPPEDVSYYNLYVNGVLQPKVNYYLTKGKLLFVTSDLPSEGESIIIRYITFAEKAVCMSDALFFAESDGKKRTYTDADAIKGSGSKGIPGCCGVSYYNLYINGVLQPTCNYSVSQGMLKLKTQDIPPKTQTVILESVTIKDVCGRLFDVEDFQYDALSHQSRLYTTHGDLTPYGKGILSPSQSTYQSLTINSVYQPDVDYVVFDGRFIITTEDLPLKGSPVSLQSIRVINHTPMCYNNWLQNRLRIFCFGCFAMCPR
jgi:hypothetical protein